MSAIIIYGFALVFALYGTLVPIMKTCILYKILSMKRTLLYLLFAVFLISCSKNKTESTTTKLPAQYRKNVIYIVGSTDNNQTMDVYLPQGRTTASTKVLILLHGGAWTEREGDKSNFDKYISWLQQLMPGYAIFNLNYRLYNKEGKNNNLIPVQVNDVKTAVEYIYNKRNEYAISDKFVLLGVSGGGHLAMMQAYKNNSLVKAKAVVSFFGPTNLTDMYNYYIANYNTTGNKKAYDAAYYLGRLLGGNPTEKPQEYSDNSPISFLNAQSPATIILQGGKDVVVPPQQSFDLDAKLKANNVTNQMVYYENMEHRIWPDDVMTDALTKIANFLKTNVP